MSICLFLQFFKRTTGVQLINSKTCHIHNLNITSCECLLSVTWKEKLLIHLFQPGETQDRQMGEVSRHLLAWTEQWMGEIVHSCELIERKMQLIVIGWEWHDMIWGGYRFCCVEVVDRAFIIEANVAYVGQGLCFMGGVCSHMRLFMPALDKFWFSPGLIYSQLDPI